MHTLSRSLNEKCFKETGKYNKKTFPSFICLSRNRCSINRLPLQVGPALDATSPTVLALLTALIVDFATVLIGIRQNAPIASLDGWVPLVMTLANTGVQLTAVVTVIPVTRAMAVS